MTFFFKSYFCINFFFLKNKINKILQEVKHQYTLITSIFNISTIRWMFLLISHIKKKNYHES